MRNRLFKELTVSCQVLANTDMRYILSHVEDDALLILDIDDTTGRVPQTMGLDGWFRDRISQFINDGHAESEAASKAIELYNLAQFASTHMVPVDNSFDMAHHINNLKRRGAKAIALTARNHELADKTLGLLSTIGVSFSTDVLKDGQFMLDGKLVEVKNGVIFANGRHKGQCLLQVDELGLFVKPLHSFSARHFVDDSIRNCDAVGGSLNARGITNCAVWHYQYAEIYLKYDDAHKARARIQEEYLKQHKLILTDTEAEEMLSASPSI